MDVNWMFELHLSIKILIAFFLGALIGWERERGGHEAGIRTFSLMAIGSCSFGLISAHIGFGDPGRIAAQIVSGIGFICVGVIFREEGRIKGLTTAATLWCSASVGLAIAYDMYVIGALTTLIILSSLSLPHFRFWKHVSKKQSRKRTAIGHD